MSPGRLGDPTSADLEAIGLRRVRRSRYVALALAAALMLIPIVATVASWGAVSYAAGRATEVQATVTDVHREVRRGRRNNRTVLEVSIAWSDHGVTRRGSFDEGLGSRIGAGDRITIHAVPGGNTFTRLGRGAALAGTAAIGLTWILALSAVTWAIVLVRRVRRVADRVGSAPRFTAAVGPGKGKAAQAGAATPGEKGKKAAKNAMRLKTITVVGQAGAPRRTADFQAGFILPDGVVGPPQTVQAFVWPMYRSLIRHRPIGPILLQDQATAEFYWLSGRFPGGLEADGVDDDQEPVFVDGMLPPPSFEPPHRSSSTPIDSIHLSEPDGESG